MGSEPSPRRSATAVAVLFFVNGMTFSNWLPRVPEVRDRLGLGNAGIGATLLGGGLGGIAASMIVGRVIERVGTRRTLTVAASILAVALPLIGFAPAAIVLLIVLTALGVLDVFNDVSMNAQGVMVQQSYGRSIMNRLHGMWSLGFLAGAVVGSTMSAAGVSVRVHLCIVGALMLATVGVVRRWLIAVDPPPRHVDASPRTRRGPSRVALVMAAAAFAVMALEAMPNEWSAVMMRDDFDAGRASGFGTVAVAGAMLIGRLGGDHVLERIGRSRLLAGALTLSAIGLTLTALAPVTAVALIGLVVWGLGLSVVFPQLYGTAAELPGMSAGAGIGSMLLGQRFGGMMTALGVGALAEWRDVQFAYLIVGAAAMTIVVSAMRALR